MAASVWAAFNMMTTSNGNIFRVTGPLWWEFTGPGKFPAQRPATRSFDAFFDLSLNKRLYISNEIANTLGSTSIRRTLDTGRHVDNVHISSETYLI